MIRALLLALTLALAAALLVACSGDDPAPPDDSPTTQTDTDSPSGDVGPPQNDDAPAGDTALPRVVVQWSPRMPQAGAHAVLTIESVNRDFRALMVVLIGPGNEVITIAPAPDGSDPANNRWSADVQIPTAGAWQVTVVGEGDVRIERTVQVAGPAVPLAQRPGLPLPGRVTTVRVLDPDTYDVRAEWTGRDTQAVWLAGEPPELVFTRLVAGDLHLIAGNPVTGDTRLIFNAGVASLRLIAAPDGRALAFWPQFSGPDDARISLFRGETGQLIQLDVPTGASFIGEWSPDSSVLLVRTSDNHARFFSIDGALLHETTSIATSAPMAWIDGNIALIEGRNRDDSIAAVRRIDPHSGQEIPILAVNDLITEIGAWRIGPDGDQIAVAARTQPTGGAWGVMVQPVASATTTGWIGDPVVQLDVDEVHQLAWTETGALMVAAFAGEGEDRQFILSEVDPDARTSRLLLTRDSPDQRVGRIAVGADRIYVSLVRCCHPPGASEVLTVGRATGRILATDVDAGVLTDLPTGPYLSNDDGLFDTAGRRVLTEPGMRHTVTPTPEGPLSRSLWAHLVGTSLDDDADPPAGPATLAVVSEQQRDSLALYEIPLTPTPDPANQRLLTSSSYFTPATPALALDDNRLLEWADRRWRVRDLTTGAIVEIDPQHEHPTLDADPARGPSAAVAPDARRVAHFALVDGALTLTISSIDTGEPLLRSDPIADGPLTLDDFAARDPDGIAGPAWSPTGTQVAAARGETLVLVDAMSGRVTATHTLPLPRTINDLVWPDDAHIYMGTRNDGLWRLTLADGSLEQLHTLPGDRPLLSLAPNRAAIAVATDQGVWVWAIPNQQLTRVSSPDGQGAMQRPVWSPASDRIVYATTVPYVFSGRFQIAGANGSGAYDLIHDDLFFVGWVFSWTSDDRIRYAGAFPGGN